MFGFDHFNFNVKDLERSLKFYDEALGLKPVRESLNDDFKLVWLGDGKSSFTLELTYIYERSEAYDLGEGEFHLALYADDIDAEYERHLAMGIVCQKRKPGHSYYFIEDPDGYWIEIVRKK